MPGRKPGGGTIPGGGLMKGGGMPGNAGGTNGGAPGIGCWMFPRCLHAKAGFMSCSVALSPASLAQGPRLPPISHRGVQQGAEFTPVTPV